MKDAGRVLALTLLLACKVERVDTVPQKTDDRLRSGSVARLPSDPVKLAALLNVPTDSLRAAGEERYNREEFDSAQSIMRVEVQRARAAGDRKAEARARMWIGLAAYHLGDYKTARSEGEASLDLKRSTGLDAELSRSYNALGLVAWNEGRYSDAIANFDSAVASARRNKDAAGVARGIANIPLVQVELGAFDDAHRGLLAALRAGREMKDHKVQGNALANLAMLDIRLGRPSSALPLLDRARAEYKEIDYTPGEANALGQLATAWAQLGDLQRAIAAADSALVIARAEGLQQEIAAELEVIADLHMQAGNARLALRRLQEADSIDAAVGLTSEQGINSRRISLILLQLGEYPASVARARQALGRHRSSGALAEIVFDRLQLANSLVRAGDIRKARAQAESASIVARASRNSAAMNDAAATVADLALTSKDPQRALVALNGLDSSALPTRSWEIDDLRARALLALGQLDAAKSAAERSVKALERERASLGMGPLRAGYLANRSAPFSHLVEIDLTRGDTAGAFRVAASLPGRNLTERVGGLAEKGRSVASIAERERMLLRVSALEQQVAGLGGEARDLARRAPLTDALEKARASYEEYVARDAAESGSGASITRSPALAEVQSTLGDDEALLNFVSGPDRLDAFVVRRNAVFHRSIALGDRELGRRIRVAREELATGGAVTPQAIGELYELLIKPFDVRHALDGATNLLVLSHGALGILPFAALWDRTSGKFLVEERTISYLPAISALAMRQAERQSQTGAIDVFAPLPDSLPGTVGEAKAIARAVSNSRVRIGDAATERTVRAALTEGRSVHIDSHGLVNAQNPLFSRITVGNRRSGNPVDDGVLDAHEILGLTTRSPLVFLSGCETGIGGGAGSVTTGFEEGSLAQAFLMAGAATVIATLWRVEDASAASIAADFYASLALRASPASALAVAQRAAIRAHRGFTWASYTVSGRDPSVIRKSGTTVRRTGM